MECHFHIRTPRFPSGTSLNFLEKSSQFFLDIDIGLPGLCVDSRGMAKGAFPQTVLQAAFFFHYQLLLLLVYRLSNVSEGLSWET